MVPLFPGSPQPTTEIDDPPFPLQQVRQLLARLVNGSNNTAFRNDFAAIGCRSADDGRASFLRLVIPIHFADYPAMNLAIETEQENDGRWIAEIPKLSGVMSYGVSRDEATQRVEALALRVLANRPENGESLPEGLEEVFPVAA